MRTARALLLASLAASAGAADAQPVRVCFNYGCSGSAEVALSEARLDDIRALLVASADAAAERDAVAAAVGRLYRIAGEQSPIAADRAGNYLDGGVPGRMDCIDHSTTTDRLLRLLESRGWLRFHRVRPVARRTMLIFQHFSAVIEEVAPPKPPRTAPAVPDHVPLLLALCDCENVGDDIAPPAPPPAASDGIGRRFVVDSWFVDHGEPAVVLALEDWMNGEGPNVQ